MDIESLTLQIENQYMVGDKEKTRKTSFTGIRPDATDAKLLKMGQAIAKLMNARPDAYYAIKRQLLVEGHEEA